MNVAIDMIKNVSSRLCITAAALSAVVSIAHAQEASPSATKVSPRAATSVAGPTDTGFLLPNGWHLTPAGRHIETNDLVLNMIPLSDGRRALASCDGFNEHYLGLFDLANGKLLSKQPANQSWFGLQVSSDEKKVWWSGGGAGSLHQFELTNESLTRISAPEADVAKLSREELLALRDKLKSDNAFRSGVCLDERRNYLYSLLINAGKLLCTSLTDGVERTLARLIHVIRLLRRCIVQHRL